MMTRTTKRRRLAPAPASSEIRGLPLGPRFRRLRSALLACSALSMVFAVAAQPARALPQGGTITEGSGQIVVKSPTEIAVIQHSDKLVIDWQSFNIAAGEKVVFVQADQLMQALNRVLGGGASTILGQLSAKGTVIITNPNGILFGNGAQVNVGAIIATTSGITNANFMAGKLNFDIPSTSDTASVVNRGTITAAEAGLVGLVAPGVENSGIILARLGTVQMAAGNTFTVDLYGDKLIKLAVGDHVTKQVKAADGKDIKALVNNTGTLSADGGAVLLTAAAARDIVKNVINLEGVAQARSVGTANGQIVLDGGTDGAVQVAGTLDARGTQAGETGGAITVLGDDIAVVDGAKLLAAGNAGGGTVKVGHWDSASATLAADSAIDASATAKGQGGRVEVIAQDTTAKGAIKAEGGAQGGDGGFIETSGHQLDISGISVSARAPKGKAGDWRLDPTDLIVDNAAAGSIATALAGTNVTLQTSAAGASGPGTANPSGNGDIIVNAGIAWGADTTLTLDAYRSVVLNAPLTASGARAGLNVLTNQRCGSGGHFLAKAPVSLPTTAALAIDGQIYTLVNDLSGLTDLSRHYALVRDVTLSSARNAMGVLTGTFEGLGHTITGLQINAPGVASQGLFAEIGASGSVRNLGLRSGYVIGGGQTGMLAGVSKGTIVNAYATGGVLGGEVTGGLVGQNEGKILYSHVDASVQGANGVDYDGVGGLVGSNSASGLISDSYAAGFARGRSAIGGLAGRNWGSIATSYSVVSAYGAQVLGGLVGTNAGSISTSYAAGQVLYGNAGSATSGGLVGDNTGTISSSFWDWYTTARGNACGTGCSGQGTKLSQYESLEQANYVGWDFDNTWYMIEGATRPFLRSEYSTSIATNHQLQLVNLDPSAHYTLANDIDMARVQLEDSMWSGRGFAPLLPLAGSFDGRGRTISNLYIDRNEGDVGLFTVIDAGAVVRDLYLTDVEVWATYQYGIGALAGRNLGTVTNVHVSGQVVGGGNAGGVVGANEGHLSASSSAAWVRGSDNIGGLVGMNGGDVSSSHASGAVGGFYPGDGYTAGGLIGVNGGSVTSSYATGAVSGQTSVGGLAGENYGTLSATFATGTVSGSNDVGGLVGNNGGTVRFSFATGATTGADDVGGLVGGNGGRVENSYATGSASGTGQYVGGLVGLNGPTAAIWASYATGAATGRTVGGLVGLSQGTIDQAYATGRVTGLGDGAGGLVGRTMVGVVSASYWDKDGTGLNAGCGNLSDCATDLTSTEAATPGSYADFDFANTWYHGPGATPILYASPFVLRVAADNQTMTAGGPVPVLTATYQNLWAGDTGAIVSGLGTTATSSSSPGTYAITGDGLSAISTTGQAYKIIYTPGTLTVVPRPASAATTVGTIQRQILGGTSPEARLRQAASLGAWHSGAPQPGELKLAVAPELKATIPGTSGLAGPEQATE